MREGGGDVLEAEELTVGEGLAGVTEIRAGVVGLLYEEEEEEDGAGVVYVDEKVGEEVEDPRRAPERAL